jgi:hypothetical protein
MQPKINIDFIPSLLAAKKKSHFSTLILLLQIWLATPLNLILLNMILVQRICSCDFHAVGDKDKAVPELN